MPLPRLFRPLVALIGCASIALLASACGSVSNDSSGGKVVVLPPDRPRMLEAMQVHDCSLVGETEQFDAWHAARFVPWFGQLKVGSSTIGAVAPKLLSYRLEGDGQMSRRRLVPVTPGAKQLLAGPTGDRVERITRGGLASFDGLEDIATARGITFARTPEEFATARIAPMLELGDVNKGPFWLFLFGSDSPKQVREEWKAYVQQFDQGGAIAQNVGWIVLGPVITTAALDPDATPAEETALLWILQHELQHGLTPPDWGQLVKKAARPICPSQEGATPEALRETLAPVNWLEEASSDTVAQFPGALTRTAEATGLRLLPDATMQAMLPADLARALLDPSAAHPISRRSYDLAVERMVHDPKRYHGDDLFQFFSIVAQGGEGYPEHDNALALLLGLASLDPTDPDDRDAVLKLLQDRPANELPDILARRIVRARKLDASVEKGLSKRIADIGADAYRQPPGTLERSAGNVVKWVTSKPRSK